MKHELTFYEAMQTKAFPLNPFVNKGGEKMGHPLIVRLPFFFFVGCSNDLGLINRENVEEIRRGENIDTNAMKTALALVNLCGNMKDVRLEPTMAAMSFVRSLTNDEYNVNNTLRKKSKCDISSTENGDDKEEEEEEGEIIEPKKRRLESSVINKKTSLTKHELTSTVNVPRNFDLDDFVSVLVDDDDFFLPEFEIREDQTEDTKLLDE